MTNATPSPVPPSSKSALLGVAFALAACSGGGSSSGADAGQGIADANPNFTEYEGRIVVEPFLRSNVVGIRGEFRDGPALAFATEADRIGACRLMTFEPSFCDPACEGFDVCIDGTCQAFPERLDKGPLSWTWPGGSGTVSPDDTNHYSASETMTEHGEVTLTVDGETLRVETGEPPQAVGSWDEDFSYRDGDVVIRWSDPVDGARVRLHMTDCAGSHGGIGEAEIFCDAADTGELTIPASFMSALDDADWSRGECGSHAVVRYRSDVMDGGGFAFESQAAAGFFYRPDFE